MAPQPIPDFPDLVLSAQSAVDAPQSDKPEPDQIDKLSIVALIVAWLSIPLFFLAGIGYLTLAIALGIGAWVLVKIKRSGKAERYRKARRRVLWVLAPLVIIAGITSIILAFLNG